MNTVEDRLRAATRAAAQTVAPGSAPPLRLPARPVRHRLSPRRLLPDRRPASSRRPRSLLRAMTPLAAAVAVIALVSASLIISHQPRGGTGTPALAHPPGYYVALTGPGGTAGQKRGDAVIKATATGATLMKVRPPRPYLAFTAVTAAADDQTFVLAAQQGHNSLGLGTVQFFLLRLGTSGHTAKLTELHIRQVPAGSELDGLALSPDGTRLAWTTLEIEPSALASVHVAALATGQTRTWSYLHGGLARFGPGPQALSWTADDATLAVDVVQGFTWSLRLLDTTVPGSSLLQDSRPVIKNLRPGPGLCAFDAIITADGSTVVCAWMTDKAVGPGQPRFLRGFAEYSARTGRLVRILDLHRYRTGIRYLGDPGPQLAWANSSGSLLIGALRYPDQPTEVISAARTTAIPTHWYTANDLGYIPVAW